MKKRFERRRRDFKKFWNIYKSNKLGLFGLGIIIFFIIIAVFSPYIATHDPNKTNPAEYLAPPSQKNWFGSNEVGQDLFSRNIYGSRISLIVGFLAAAVAISIGVIIGLISGYFGGWIDEILMRITDFFLVIPALVLMIVVAALLGQSLINVIIVIGVLSWSSTARIVRSMALSIREWPFIEGARASGGGDFYIIFKHILPNVMPIVYANAALTISNAIFSQAALVFLGVGDVSDISWGSILHYAFSSGALGTGKWWYFVPPGVFILLMIYGFILIGYSLEEILNPRLRRR